MPDGAVTGNRAIVMNCDSSRSYTSKRHIIQHSHRLIYRDLWASVPLPTVRRLGRNYLRSVCRLSGPSVDIFRLPPAPD